METIAEIEDCRSLGDLAVFAASQPNAPLIQAAITAAYYIGHNDGQRAAADVAQLRRKE